MKTPADEFLTPRTNSAAVRRLMMIAVLCLLTAPGVLSQPQTERRQDLPLPIPHIIYTIRAEVTPESTLVRGQMEVEYENVSNDTLSQIWFKLNPQGSFHLDSILYYGAPLPDSMVLIDDSLMRVTLPQKLAPGRSGFFLLAFETGLPPPTGSIDDEPVLFADWHPSVCLYRDWRRLTGWRSGPGADIREYSLYNVELRIDSAWSIVHPGELINEKEHYGLLPLLHDDTVLTDIVGRHSYGPGGAGYKAEFPSGIKQYLVRARTGTDLVFAAHPDLVRDRATAGKVAIEVCYPRKLQSTWAVFVARSTAALVRQYEQVLGEYPHSRLTIVAAHAHQLGSSARQLVILPAAIRDTGLLHTALAVELANCWFPTLFPENDGTGRWLNHGLACYLAATIMYHARCSAGWQTMRELRQWTADNIGSEESTQRFISSVFRKIPAGLHALRFAVGDDTLFAAIREYVLSFRHRLTYPGDFSQLLSQRTGSSSAALFDEIMVTGDSIDFGVSDLKTGAVAGGYDISYKVTSNGPVALPIEVGYVINATDTIYDTLVSSRFPAGTVSPTVHRWMALRPKAIVLDPNHYLPDCRRSNNYRFVLPVRFRYSPPRTLFPAYDLGR
ncbi:MAG: hypothetical protein ABII79_02925 [bacterium]